ncbi:hypothetical protein WICANDRAFT_62007 [Wickerhamomyces anomalus NRRL Y-366-8]|uniref:DBF4-type domain-containing protein n=1 Tax=Wickerhamomyces anomalus (strain ATCC 58044 / CBS 1984 / NCYC 433 / NRRL Y-366-8) TaxID=683960 RepID=A0A1E3P7Q0_WICAA|nr:uncharacterized protein WICANDRAFT_62007 [Wickerhamomyces anomalus NRRL Y-366-8]ODQ61449.1 hypothetical protein WICANDRAFT_62007 [Wickerhamomyces anomalus NRRL Y-366-8]
MEAHRQPLRDIGTNSPTVKRQKLSNNGAQSTKHELRQEIAANDLSDWQRSWRRIMRESVIYFDSNDISTGEFSSIKKKEKEKAIKLFTQVGATIQQFFDNRVTIVVSRRSRTDLPRNMLQSPHPLKFWNYEKVFRFLKNLGEITSPVQTAQKNARHLSSLLHDEKLHGPNDRDPNAKREDFNYFKHPFFYVYDLRQVTRPVAVREWKVKDTSSSKTPWPHVFTSTYGRSPFLADPADIHLPRKTERRRLRDEQNKRYRDKLRVVYNDFDPQLIESNPFSDDSDVESDSTLCERESTLNMPPPLPENSLVLSRQPSLISNKFMEATKRDNFEIQASGFNGSTNVSQQSTEVQTKNGLAPIGSSVASKQVNSLTKKLIVRKQKLSKTQASKNKPKVAGYCENCRIHFDDFDEHIESGKHRSFATENSNFRDIDDLIDKLNDDIAFKR